MTIDSFRGTYFFLSNFYPVDITWDTLVFPTVEHAYQAAKTLNFDERLAILAVSPKESKKMGREVTLRPNWDSCRLPIMEYLLRQKFSYPYLRDSLLITKDRELIEGNTCREVFWGVYYKSEYNVIEGRMIDTREGENHLGKLLMKIRGELRESTPA